jgi:regulator of RNase E activity RraA
VLRGGVGVHPGQYVFADASGAVVIPEAEIDDVLSDALEIRAQDAHTREQIAAEHRGNNQLGEDLHREAIDPNQDPGPRQKPA